GAAAGEGQPVHFQEGNDVLIESAVLFELVREVENDFRLKALELLTQQFQVVEDGEVFVRVTEFAQRRHDIALGLPALGLEVRSQIFIDAETFSGSEQGQDFEFFLQGYFVRLNLPVNR